MKQKNLILMGVAIACGLVAAVLTAKMGAPTPIETVKVLTATKDLTTGTSFTKTNVEEFTMVTDVPKSAIPPEAKLISSKEELVGKRLTRATHAGEYFNAADVNSKTVLLFEAGKDIMSLPMSASKAAGGFVGPGSRVDIVGSVVEGKNRRVFTLLPDMHVLAVNGIQDLVTQTQFPDMSTVSFSVTEDEAKLIALANQRSCHLELLLRHPDAPHRFPTPELREAARKTTLQMLRTLGDDNSETSSPEKAKEDAKKEEVEVYVAKENIESNTQITSELIETKFTKVKKPKTAVEGACLDLKPHVGPPAFEAFKLGVAKGQYVTDSMIGKIEIVKAPPADIEIANKPEPKIEDMPPLPKEVAIAPLPHLYIEPPPAAPRIRDVALHTNQGSLVHRYQETGVETNEWKLIAILTPTDAAMLKKAIDKRNDDKKGDEKKPDDKKSDAKID